MKRKAIIALLAILLMSLAFMPLFANAKSGVFVGIDGIDLPKEASSQMQMKNVRGLLITRVVPDSPADKAGLITHDIILRIDRHKIKSKQGFIKVMKKYNPQQEIQISILRYGKQQTIPVILAACPQAQEPKDLSFDQDKKARIDDLLSYVDKHNSSMGSLAIGNEEGILYARAIGFRKEGAKKSLTANPETRYRIGSITKMFTSVMIHQLFEEGKLSPETKLSQFFPDIPNARKITLRMMLTHQSGIASYTEIVDYFEWSAQPRSREEIIQKILDQKPRFKPGKKAIYSNSNYLLLGYIIEKIDGVSYAEALQRRICKKTGLKHTEYGGKIDVLNNDAISYNNDGQWIEFVQADMSTAGGAGAIISTASELVLFIQALFGGKLISANSLEQMLIERDGMGSGILKMTIGANTYYGHGGKIDNFLSLLAFSPKDKHAVVYLQNGSKDPNLSIMALTTGILSDQQIKLPEYQESFHIADLSPFCGRFYNSDIRMSITVSDIQNVLYTQADGQRQVKMDAISEDSFQCQAIGLVISYNADRTSFTLKQRGHNLVFVKQ